MSYSRGILIGIAASLLVAGSYVIAQEEEEHQIHHPGAQANQDDPGTGDLAGSGMMGSGTMRGMMGGGGKPCRMMHRGMGGGMMDRMIYIPRLPPGNEKLQLMMQAEILQKVGEVQAKYAAQIKEPAAPAP